MNPQAAVNEYNRGHIPGAYRIDMEQDLAGTVKEHGGRHPLPDLEGFVSKLESYGVSTDTTIVAYDDDLSGSARLWFILTHLGHRNARILDGGIISWKNLGFELTSDPSLTSRRGNLTYRTDFSDMITMADIRNQGSRMMLIDSRAKERYLGNLEPIDRKAGHIPGAVNIDYHLAEDEFGRLKDADDLKDLYSQAGSEPVVYCGSGVTSCVNYVAMKRIGLNPKLYLGSWSDWISYYDNPIAVGSES